MPQCPELDSHPNLAAVWTPKHGPLALGTLVWDGTNWVGNVAQGSVQHPLATVGYDGTNYTLSWNSQTASVGGSCGPFAANFTLPAGTFSASVA